MPLQCPSCGVKNPPRARACALCRYDFTTRQPLDTSVLAAGGPSQTPLPEPAVSEPVSKTLVLEAPFMRMRGLVGTAVMGLMLLPTMFFSLLKAPIYPLMMLFSWMLVALLIPQVLLLIRPRRLLVEGDRFVARGIPAISTSIQNLFLVAHDGVGLCVRFHSLEGVDCPAKLRVKMEQNAFKSGHHLSFPGFTFAQSEVLRQRAGLPEEQFNATLTHVRAYQQKIRQLTPRLFMTYTLVAINCLVYLLMVATGVDWLNPTLSDLINWGADFGPYTTNGQGWRLITCCFIHIGLFHLFFNMWAFLTVGPLMERLLGHTGLLILYVSSGLFGSVLSSLWNPLVVCAGASGAIFGVFGGMLGFLVLHRQSMPVTIYHQVWRSGVAFLVFNLIFAWGMPGIDMAAHLGGAIAGFFGGMVLSQPLDEHTGRMRFWRNLLLAGMAILLLGPAFIYLPRPSGPDADWSVATIEYYAAGERLMSRYNRMRDRCAAKEATDEDFHQLLTLQLLPEWNSWQARLKAIGPLKGHNADAQKDLLTFMQIQREGWQLLAQAIEKQDLEIVKQANAKFEEASRFGEKMNK